MKYILFMTHFVFFVKFVSSQNNLRFEFHIVAEIVDEDGFQFPKKSRRGFKYSHPFSVFYQIEKTIRVLVRRQPSHIHKFKSLLASLGIVTVEMIVSFL